MFEIGSSLREARKQLGLDLDAAAEATLIRNRFLDALEQERFDLLPEGFYRRSFLRRYAEFLGLDANVVLGEYDERLAAAQPAQPQPPRRPRDVASQRLTLVALACMLLAAVIAVAVWQLGGRAHPPRVTTSAAPSAPRPHPQPRRPAHHRQRHPRHPRTPRPAAVLVLRAASGSCWLLVRAGSASGQVLFTGTLQRGQRARFGLARPLWLRFGAPDHIAATLAGRTIALPLGSGPGNVRASALGLRTAP